MVDVFREIGKLSPANHDAWRSGKIPYLERAITLNLPQINLVCRTVHADSQRGTLKPSPALYHRYGKGPKQKLRFTKSGDPKLEQAWATHYLLPVTEETRNRPSQATSTTGEPGRDRAQRSASGDQTP
jgi:hypothetical protein